MTSTGADAFARLEHEFALLHGHLIPLRVGAEGGLTALRARLDRLAIAALAANASGAYLAANHAAAQLTGFSVRELESMSVWDLTPADGVPEGRRLWTAFVQAGEQRGIYWLTGKAAPVQVAYVARAHVLPNTHVSLLVGLSHDPHLAP